MILSDVHTHTCFCDGRNTPEEMLRTAVEKGFVSYGFSGHAYLAFDPSWTMDADALSRYVTEVKRLKEEYRGKIEVLLGTEYDFYSELNTAEFDYVIGSVHCLLPGGNYAAVDESEAVFLKNVERYYGGDFYEYVKAYYATEQLVAERTGCDIIGHFDAVNKFNPHGKYFDEKDLRYRQAAADALCRLVKSGVPFELNTAAVYRHDSDHASPSAEYWLRVLCECGGSIIINSDAHSTDRIGDHFEQAGALAKSCGFRTALILRADGFEEIRL